MGRTSNQDLHYLKLDYLRGKLRGKRVFVRVDTNTTLVEGRIRLNERIKGAATTLSRLADEGARIIVGTHNGRAGEPSWVSVGELLDYMAVVVKGNIHYIGNTYDAARATLNEEALQKVEALRDGDGLLLENLRFLAHETDDRSPEQHADCSFVKTLLDKCKVDYYVNDAFSSSHRSHCSIVGFGDIPNFAGLQMQQELEGAQQILERFSHRKSDLMNVYVLGGVKIQDYLDMVETSLKERRVQKILAGGVLANLCLVALGHDLGRATKQFLTRPDASGKTIWSLRGRLERLLKKYREFFELPTDLAVNEGGRRVEYTLDELRGLGEEAPVLDIGRETTRRYIDIVKQAQLIFTKGPMGAYEVAEYNFGSRELMNAITLHSQDRAFSVLGGGDSVVMLDAFGISKNQFDYISQGGGALLEFLAGQRLPGLVALDGSWRRHHKSLAPG